MFDYDIFYSGSKGNFNKITHGGITFAIDIGKPYRYLESNLYDVDVLLISHIHQDHYLPSTYNRIRLMHPNIVIISNQQVWDKVHENGGIPPDYILNAGEGIQIGDIYIRAFENEHGEPDKPVDCTGWIFYDGYSNILYSTDLSTTIHYSMYLDKHNIQLNTILLEANYDPEVVGFIENMKLHSGFDIFNNGSGRHLAKTEFDTFVEKYAIINEQGLVDVMPLHLSETYFSFAGMMKKFPNVTENQIRQYKEGKGIEI